MYIWGCMLGVCKGVRTETNLMMTMIYKLLTLPLVHPSRNFVVAPIFETCRPPTAVRQLLIPDLPPKPRHETVQILLQGSLVKRHGENRDKSGGIVDAEVACSIHSNQ
jgi:hypothetical protein